MNLLEKLYLKIYILFNKDKKYKLTNNTIEHLGKTLYQIQALRDIPRHNVKQGDLGGFIEHEGNLSHFGDAWVSGNAYVNDNARVYGNACVSSDARVIGNACVNDNARVYGNAWVSGNAYVSGDACVKGNAYVRGNSVLRAYDEVTASNQVVNITGFTYNITVTPMSIHIGCKDYIFDQLDEEVKGLPQEEIDQIKCMVELAVDRIYSKL